MVEATDFDCHQCDEPALEHTGPRDNGERTVALLVHDGVLYVFCSSACRTRWFDVVGNGALDADEKAALKYADDVDEATLNEFADAGFPVPKDHADD